MWSTQYYTVKALIDARTNYTTTRKRRLLINILIFMIVELGVCMFSEWQNHRPFFPPQQTVALSQSTKHFDSCRKNVGSVSELPLSYVHFSLKASDADVMRIFTVYRAVYKITSKESVLKNREPYEKASCGLIHWR